MSDGSTDDPQPSPPEPTARATRDARREGHDIEKQHRSASHKGGSKNEKRGRKGKSSKGSKGSGSGHQHDKEAGPR